MNWLDIVVIVMLIVPTLIGFKRGLIGTVVPLIGIILGIVLAGRFYGSIADWLSTWLHSPSQARIVGFIIIFVLVMVAMAVLAAVLRRFLGLLLLGWVDKLAGLVFGFLIGGLVMGAVLALASKFFPAAAESTIQGSALASFLLDKFPLVLYFLPSEFEAVRHFFG